MKTPHKSFHSALALLLTALALVGCDRKPKRYGPLEFESVGVYSAFVIAEEDSSPEMVRGENRRTGIGGKVLLPSCHRWGVVVFASGRIEELASDLNDASCPELLIYDWDSKGTGLTDADLLHLTSLTSLRRLDLQLCPTLSPDVVRELAALPNLEQLWLPASGDISDALINELSKDRKSLRVERGVEPTGRAVGNRVNDALRQGR